LETNPITILIVDDHALTRAGVKVFTEQDPRIKVIGEASNGEEAIALAASLAPAVVIMDLFMPVIDGIEASKQIVANNPNIKIVMLTSHSGKTEVSAALAAGVNAYCLKDVNDERLMSAIYSAFNGDLWIDASIASDFICTVAGTRENDYSIDGKSNDGKVVRLTIAPNSFSLTERELQVLNLIVSGKTNQEIAAELFLSVDTIKSHLKTIMSKLNVDDRTQAAVKAVREGLIA